MKNFKLTESVVGFEECGFRIEFQELKIRGKNDVIYQVFVSEESAEVPVNDTYQFSSWEIMKEQYPTLLDFLIEVASNELWFSSWCNYERIYFIEILDGNDGLYDINSTVWYNALTEDGHNGLYYVNNSILTVEEQRELEDLEDV